MHTIRCQPKTQLGCQEVRGLNQMIKNRIGAWLVEPDHTKQDLASRLGMTVKTLNTRLDESVDWSWGEVKLLAALFGCSVDELE